MYTYDVPVTKTTSALLAFIKDEAAVEELHVFVVVNAMNIVRLNLMPIGLQMAAIHNEYEKFKKLDGMECCGCGCCSYVCPAKRSLTQSIVQTKQRILKENK